jgi:hypothetical protein
MIVMITAMVTLIEHSMISVATRIGQSEAQWKVRV